MSVSGKTNRRRIAAIMSLGALPLVFLIVGAAALADDPGESKPAAKQSGPSKDSLDDELLKGLSNDLLDGVDELPKIKTAEKNATTEKTEKHAAEATKPADGKSAEAQQPIDGEDLGQPREDRDPLSRISRQMRDVQRRLSSVQAGDDTQHRQQQISDELAKLIERLKKTSQSSQKPGNSSLPSSQRSKVAQAGQKGANSRQSDKPARDSSNQTRRDEVTKADPAAIRERMKEAWGNLPQRIREQMMQTSVDDFLPKYELLIEKYFQRLSEEETPQP
jgi:hypothetical protein